MKLCKIFAISLSLFAVPACEKNESLPEKTKETVNDALDRRPAEEIQDVAEDIGDAVKGAAEETKESIE